MPSSPWLTGLLLLAAGSAGAGPGRSPGGPTQGRVIGTTYLNRPAGYTHQLPASWISHGYRWYEYWGPHAAQARPGAAFVADWVYVPVDRTKPEARLLAVAVYPSAVWQALEAEGGAGRAGPGPDRPVGVRLDRPPGRALRRRLARRRPAGDGPVRRRAHHHGSFRLLDAAGPPPPVLCPHAGPGPSTRRRCRRCASQNARTARWASLRAVPARGPTRVRRREPRAAWTRASRSRATPWPAPSIPPSARTPRHRDGPAARDDRRAGPSGALSTSSSGPTSRRVRSAGNRCRSAASPATYACQAPGAWSWPLETALGRCGSRSTSPATRRAPRSPTAPSRPASPAPGSTDPRPGRARVQPHDRQREE